MKETKGIIDISYHIDCPHCGERITNEEHGDWWDRNIPPFCDEWDVIADYEVKCPECEQDFTVKGFEV